MILDIFNTRELAIIAWAIVFFAWLLRKPDVLKSFLSSLKTLPRLWKIFASMIAYIGLSIFALKTLSLWNIGLLKVTIFWFFGWAFFMLINISRIKSERHYFKKTISEIIGLTVIVSFVENFYTFPLIVELFLVPFIVLIVTLAAYSKIKNEYLIGRVMNQTLVLVGFIVLVMSIGEIIVNFPKFVAYATLQEFLLPMLLSLMYLPYLYLLSWYMQYEQKKILDKFQKD